MGSVLLGIVAGRNRDENKLSSDLNNNFEIGECALTKEYHLLETPLLGIKHTRTFKTDLVTQKAAKIGKIAKLTDRKVSGEKLFEDEVSHFSYQFIVYGTGRLSSIQLRVKVFAAAEKKTLAMIRNEGMNNIVINSK
jgi:hypothetical protein